MKKSEMIIINNEVLTAWEIAKQAWMDLSDNSHGTRLRSCNAAVFETSNYIFLVSYQTVVAFIDKSTDTLYDVLRYVYGYTHTSAQHISKFDSDYGAGKWRCAHRLTYYPI